MLTNNHINSGGGGAGNSENQDSIATADKKNFMPLHDFNDQRIAAMLGTNNNANKEKSPQTLILFFMLLLLMPSQLLLQLDAHLAQI